MSDSSPASGLSIIRVALIAGVVATGGVFWYISDHLEGPILEAGMRSTVRLGILGFWAVMLLIISVIRRRRTRAPSAHRQRMLTVVGWALAEAIALVGVVYYFLTGAALLFFVGLLIQLGVSFIMLPIPSE